MLLCTLLYSVIPIFRTFLKRSVLQIQFFRGYYGNCPSQWLRSLRRGSGAVRLQGLCTRIPLGAWMSVSCEFCQAEVSVASRSLVQRSSTECVVCLSVILNPQKWGGLGPTRAVESRKKKNGIIVKFHILPPLFLLCLNCSTLFHKRVYTGCW